MHIMNLRRIRELRGLKQADLADMIGKDKSTVSRAEAMHPTAKLETYQLCAVALGITLADIFCDDITPVKRELLDMIDRLPEDKLATVSDLLKMAVGDGRAADQ